MTAFVRSTQAAPLSAALRQIDEWIGPNGVNGAAAAVWFCGELVAERYAGESQPGMPADDTTLFALASVTKPIVAAAAMCLVEDGSLGLDEPIVRIIPEFAEPVGDSDLERFRADITVRQVLSHTSGLPEDLTTRQVRYADKPSLDELIDAICRTALVDPPGTEMRYSNPGYGIIARIIHRISDRDVWDFVWDRVFDSLDLLNIIARPGPALVGRIASVADTPRPGTATDAYNSAYWRELGIPWGGLFGSVRDVVRFAGAFLPDGPRLLSSAGIRTMTSDQVRGLPGGVGSLKLRWPRAFWGLGWEVKGTKTRHWTGELTSPHTFCHFGAAGSLVWADPDHQLALAVVGNRMTFHLWPFVPARWARLSNALVAAVT